MLDPDLDEYLTEYRLQAPAEPISHYEGIFWHTPNLHYNYVVVLFFFFFFSFLILSSPYYSFEQDEDTSLSQCVRVCFFPLCLN